MGSYSALLLVAGAVSLQLPAEFYQDFRGSQFPTPPIKKFTQGNPDDIKPEPQGVRITVPRNELPSPRAGVGPTFRVGGNFEITASYELLSTGDQPKGGGAGAVLQVLKDPTAPFPKNAAVTRVVHPKMGDVFAGTLSPIEEGGNPVTRFFPNDLKAGKLRLVRNGSILRWQFSAGPADIFGDIRQPMEFGPQEVMVRLFADPGKDKTGTGSVDLRFLDLRIRADAIPGAPKSVANPPDVLPGAPNVSNPHAAIPGAPKSLSNPPTMRTWWIAGGVGGLLLLLFGTALAFYWLRRSPATNEAKQS